MQNKPEPGFVCFFVVGRACLTVCGMVLLSVWSVCLLFFCVCLSCLFANIRPFTYNFYVFCGLFVCVFLVFSCKQVVASPKEPDTDNRTDCKWNGGLLVYWGMRIVDFICLFGCFCPEYNFYSRL